MGIDKNDKVKIDSIFRNVMEEHHDAEDEAAALWENGFKEKVVKQNFYRFGLGHYNLYTAFAVAYTVLSVALVLLYAVYHITQSSRHTNSSSANTSSGKALTIDSLSMDQYQNQLSKSQRKKTLGVLKGQNIPASEEANANDELMVASNSVDSVNSVSSDKKPGITEEAIIQAKEEVVVPKTASVKKEKRTIVIENRDTLEMVDTIRSKKEWRKHQKNK
jgi:hypothetical protein